MHTRTIATLTDQPNKWSAIQKKQKNKINFVIANDTNSVNTFSQNNNIDLLIVAQNEEPYQTLDIQSFSNFVGAQYTLLVPPENLDHFIKFDFPRIASSLYQPPDIKNVKQQRNRFSDAIQLNGFLLGPFHILINGLLINDFSSRKTKSLLAYLLYHNRRPNFRETLMEKFWPDVGAESARNSLNVAIHGIRQIFRDILPKRELLVFKHDKYFFNPDIEVKLDHEDFFYRLKRGQRIELNSGVNEAISDYEQAVRIYKGDFLEDNIYDEWSYSERESIKEGYLHALDRLSEYYSSNGKYKLALHYCRKLLDKDRCREDIHQRMMRCLYRTGHRDLAVKQFRKCEAILINELDIIPGTKTLELLEEIKRG